MFGDVLVAADERRDGDASRHWPDALVEDPEEQSRGPCTRLAHVHVRVREVHDARVGEAQHLVGQDAVEVERHDDRDVVAEDRPRLLEEVALGVHLAVGDHRAVEAEVDAVDLGVRANGVEELSREFAKSLGAQDAVGGIGPAAPASDGRDSRRRLEDLERATDLSGTGPLRLEQLLAVVLGEVASVARDRD